MQSNKISFKVRTRGQVPVSLTLPNCPAVCIFVGRISRTFDAKYLADWQSRLQQEQLCGFLVASCR